MSNLKVAVGSLLVLTAAVAQATDSGTSPVFEQECTCVVAEDEAFRTFPVVIRDFRSSHPDFENPIMGEDHNIVATDIGPDRRPVYAPGEEGTTLTTNGKEYFDQWYRNVEGVNIAINKSLTMVNEGSGAGYTRWKYTNNSFFPIDGEGFGNEHNYHNYHFTLETHLRFFYAPDAMLEKIQSKKQTRAEEVMDLEAELLALYADPETVALPPQLSLRGGAWYSRLAVEEAARLLQLFGAETRIFDPSDLPLPDQVGGDDHPAVHELREHAFWSEGMVWCSPERHGQITGIMKTQIDHLPLSIGGMRPTQGRTLAVMQVSAGSQSFNTVNTLRLLGRWMRMFTIPNQSSVPKAYEEFDGAGRMKPSPLYDRIVDVMEELVRFTVLLRPHAEQLVDRYSERKEAGRAIDPQKDISAIALNPSS